MAGTLTLINATGFDRGVRQDETGINIESIKCDIEPEFTETLKDRLNCVRAIAQGPMKLTVSIQGDFNTGLTGIMGSVLGTGITIANTTAYFGAPTTGKYLMKASVEEKRDGWGGMTLEAEAYAGVT